MILYELSGRLCLEGPNFVSLLKYPYRVQQLLFIRLKPFHLIYFYIPFR